ncbi:ABC transporter substrate-binding protein [Afipia sp. Root123D2]|uniref:ABC transporter substrate-binding protein n=1 Tax=Afipia sp. Root123D2 TaxID=1736436 RepID=UPI0006FE70DD|nr:ABC transporter substrate-binding protein [Afipia sp. Root123D2]KQW22643.1 ABC transporter substrate-binding protein [Afipia sp. Root123D2]
MAKKLSRRSFLGCALAGGAAAGTANLTIMRDAFAQSSGPLVIGHHCDMTGVISSWGVWHDKAARAAADIINQGGGIAGRKVVLATEDTESNPASGARKLRNLIQRANAEFVIGSVHSGVMLAAIPIASELKTIYFSTGEATEATGSKGTRYSFRTGTDTYSIAAASMPWCVENFGKAWSIIYADYAWGQSTNQESRAFIEKAGGKIINSIAVPLDTKDFVPYLAQISADTEVLLPAFIGSLSLGFYTQAKSMGLDKKMKMFSSSASIESIAPDDIQGAAEGVYFFENFPRMLSSKNDEYHKEFNKRLNIDDMDARLIGGQAVMDKSHCWQAWEDLFALKQAIEKAGYKTRKDVEGVIQALEGMEMKNSLGHPQGDKMIRKEDHVGIMDCYISRVVNGKLALQKRVPKEDLLKNMPVRHNLSAMPV